MQRFHSCTCPPLRDFGSWSRQFFKCALELATSRHVGATRRDTAVRCRVLLAKGGVVIGKSFGSLDAVEQHEWTQANCDNVFQWPELPAAAYALSASLSILLSPGNSLTASLAI